MDPLLHFRTGETGTIAVALTNLAGEAADADAPGLTVTATSARTGEAVTTTVQHGVTGAYVILVAPSAEVDLLTVAWSALVAGSARAGRERVPVSGPAWLTTAQLVAYSPRLAERGGPDGDGWSDAAMADILLEVELSIEAMQWQAWTSRWASATRTADANRAISAGWSDMEALLRIRRLDYPTYNTATPTVVALDDANLRVNNGGRSILGPWGTGERIAIAVRRGPGDEPVPPELWRAGLDLAVESLDNYGSPGAGAAESFVDESNRRVYPTRPTVWAPGLGRIRPIIERYTARSGVS